MLCSICGERGIIKQHFSGRVLCKKCLYRDLVKRTKRVVGEYRMLEPRDRILVVVGKYLEDFVAARILWDMERKYPTTIFLLLSQDRDEEKMVSRYIGEIDEERIVKSPKEPWEVARKLKCTKIVVGITLEEYLASFLFPKFLYGVILPKERISEKLTIIRPTIKIMLKEMKLVTEEEIIKKLHTKENEITRFLENLESKHEGILFSFYKGTEKLMKEIKNFKP